MGSESSSSLEKPRFVAERLHDRVHPPQQRGDKVRLRFALLNQGLESATKHTIGMR
ncbi:MAG TPA: hypothetical protein VI541_01530 [Actinomycetota bacterium]|nr:hypothetical protein [Actinomycetota bacterium]